MANSFNWNEGGYNNSQPFYLSSAGYGVFRDTFAPGLYDFADPVTTAAQERRFDGYFFYGPDLKKIIGQYTDLVGKPFMPPVYGLEPGDADCYLHNANRGERHTLDALKVADGYTQNQTPLGWMLVNDGYGCGYEDLAQTGQGLRDHNMQLGLWTSTGLPNQGEEAKAGVRVRKLDVGWVGPGYQFALDGCQTAKDGIEQNSDARGFVWLPVSWAGVQRCGVVWSGDQTGTDDYLKWQIPTYAGATMSGIAYDTGDVGGIFGSDPQVETRDLEWKTFIPTIMTMDGWATSDKQPWRSGAPYAAINNRYLQLKERLLPYFYTLAAQAHRSGVGPVRPLVLDYPNDPNTWGDAAKYEFLSGDDFLIAPVYDGSQTRSGIYLPKGTWVDYWSGRTYQGPTTIDNYQAPLDTLPLFVKSRLGRADVAAGHALLADPRHRQARLRHLRPGPVRLHPLRGRRHHPGLPAGRQRHPARHGPHAGPGPRGDRGEGRPERGRLHRQARRTLVRLHRARRRRARRGAAGRPPAGPLRGGRRQRLELRRQGRMWCT